MLTVGSSAVLHLFLNAGWHHGMLQSQGGELSQKNPSCISNGKYSFMDSACWSSRISCYCNG